VEARSSSEVALVARLTPFAVPDSDERAASSIAGLRGQGRNFAPERADDRGQRLRVRGGAHQCDLQAARQSRGGRRCGPTVRASGICERADATTSLLNLDPASTPSRTVQATPRNETDAGGRRLGPRSRLRDRQASPSSPSSDILGDRLVRPEAQNRAGRKLENIILRGHQALSARRPRGPCRPRHRPLRRPQDGHGGRRSARLPGAAICRRPAAAAGGEYRASDPLRLGGFGGRARPPRRRGVAGPQGQDEAPHPRDGGRTHQGRRRALREARPESQGAGGALRRVRRALRLPGDRGSGQRHRRRARRPQCRAADGPPRLRRCRLRQDRGGAARRLRRGDLRQAGGGGGAHHPARPPTLPDVCRALQRTADQRRPALALRLRRRSAPDPGGARRGQGRYRGGHPRAAGEKTSRSRISASSSSTRSSISVWPTRSG
jgi:hypothetical protein